MSSPDQCHCRWCGALIERPRRGQKFCSDNHRYLWHKKQRITPAQLEGKIREMVDERIRVKLDEELTRRGIVGSVSTADVEGVVNNNSSTSVAIEDHTGSCTDSPA